VSGPARRATRPAWRVQCVAGLAVVLGLGLTLPAHADCDEPIDGPWDTGIDAQADCDGDGVTPEQGDCDDRDDQVRPGVDEICGDRIDNDCDGFVDGECGTAARGQVQGGASCVSGSGAQTLVLLPLLLLPLGRRRRRNHPC